MDLWILFLPPSMPTHYWILSKMLLVTLLKCWQRVVFVDPSSTTTKVNRYRSGWERNRRRSNSIILWLRKSNLRHCRKCRRRNSICTLCTATCTSSRRRSCFEWTGGRRDVRNVRSPSKKPVPPESWSSCSLRSLRDRSRSKEMRPPGPYHLAAPFFCTGPSATKTRSNPPVLTGHELDLPVLAERKHRGSQQRAWPIFSTLPGNV